MKQNDVATLPANAGPNAKTPVQAKIAPVKSASTDAAATRMTTSPDGATSGPDLLVPASENVPLPQGMATKKPAVDLLCESAEECPAPTEKDKDGADQERARYGMQARTQLSKRQLREREQKQGQGQGQEHRQEQEPDDPALEPTATAWLLIDPNDPAGSGGGPRGKSGKRSKNKAGGASTARPDADWSASDILMESGDRLHRLAVVAHTFIQQLRPPKMNRSSALPALRAKSRAECERRCGSDGFCDPSSPLGCGGLHCGRQSDVLY
jgi:hypothetical protein